MAVLAPISFAVLKDVIIGRLSPRRDRPRFSLLDSLATADRMTADHSALSVNRELGNLLRCSLKLSEAAWQRQMLELVQRQFRSRYAALVGQRDGVLSVQLATGHGDSRFKHALSALVAPFFLRGETTLFGYHCCSDDTLPETTLQAFGVERMLLYPLKMALRGAVRPAHESAGYYVIWLGYGGERPSGAVVRRLLELLRRVESELIFGRRIAALERAAAHARRSNVEKSRALADYSHDLCAILHNIDLALALLAGQREREDLPLIEIASANCRDLLDLNEGILECSRDSGDIARRVMTRFDLALICRERVERARLQADLTGIALRCDGQETFIDGDRRQLGRVLQNLIANALRSTTKGEIGVAWGVAGKDVWLSVRDTGCGMTSKAVAALCAKARRTPAAYADTDRYETGYRRGMSLVQSIVAVHGGAIKIESQPGGGTTVTITLPNAASGSVDSSALSSR